MSQTTRLEWSVWHGAHRVQLGHQEVERVRELLGERPPLRRRETWIALCLCAVSAVLILWSMSYSGPTLYSLVPIVVFVCVAMPMLIRPRTCVIHIDPVKLGAALVQIGRCGVCAYDVRGLAPEADGCVVCPECGAAWKPTAREAQTSTMRAP